MDKEAVRRDGKENVKKSKQTAQFAFPRSSVWRYTKDQGLTEHGVAENTPPKTKAFNQANEKLYAKHGFPSDSIPESPNAGDKDEMANRMTSRLSSGFSLTSGHSMSLVRHDTGPYNKISNNLSSSKITENSTATTKALDRFMQGSLSPDVLKHLILRDAEDAAQQKSRLEDEMVELRVEADRSRHEVVRFEKNNHVQSEHLLQKDEELHTLQGKLAHYKEYAAFLEKQSEEDEARNEKRIFELRQELEAKNHELNLKEHDLEICQDDLEFSTESLQERDNAVQDLASQVESMDRVVAEGAELATKIDVLEELLRQRTEDMKLAQKELAKLNFKYTVLQAANERKIEALEHKAEKDIKQLSSKIVTLKNRKGDMDLALKQSRAELKELRDEFADYKLQAFFNPTDSASEPGPNSNSGYGMSGMELMLMDDAEEVKCNSSLVRLPNDSSLIEDLMI